MRFLLLALLLTACGPSDLDDDDDATGDDDDTVDADPTPVADLDISAITANQGIEVALMEDGDLVTRNAPIISGRPLLMRAYVAPLDGFESGRVLGRLTFDGVVYEDEILVSGASEAGDRGSTLSWELEGQDVHVDSTYEVELLDANGGPGADGNRDRWPEGGDEDLGAEPAGGVLKLVVVPVRWDQDGSGRLPDTSPEQLDLFTAAMSRVYPTSEVEVSVGPELPWSSYVDAAGNGWNDLLNAVLQLRSTYRQDPQEYWYGLFMPAPTRAEWCANGCRLGLGFVTQSASNEYYRAGLGMGYSQFQSMETMAHELGHMHGRYHAPCGGPTGVDEDYPYEEASIGGWGWDIFGVNDLFDPDVSVDFMSYCDPIWVSDYTFTALHQRMRAVGGAAFIQGVPRTWWSAPVAADGTVGKARPVTLRLPPAGEGIGALDEDGAPLQGVFAPATHFGGGVAVFPRPPQIGSVAR